MANRVNYLYSTDYKGYSMPSAGLSLSGQKNGVTQASNFHYQPNGVAKENIALTSSVPASQGMYQQIQYSTASGRTVQRTASPMIIQHPRYTTANNNTSSNAASNSATKYQIPSYQTNGTLTSNQSAEKAGLQNNAESLTRSSVNSPYILQQQQPSQFNNSQALRSPYVSSFTTTTATTNNVPANGSAGSTATQHTQPGRSISVLSGQNYTQPQVAQSLILSSGTQSGQASSLHQSVPSSVLGGASTNAGSNSSNNSSSFTAVYSQLASTMNSKIGLTSTSSTSYNGVGSIPSSVADKNLNITRPYTHARALSTNTPSRIEDYGLQSTSAAEQLSRQDSLSPSKRVTFNLARNTYTDIEQIEKRLNESTRLRPAEEAEDSRDRTTTAIFAQVNGYEDDLSKRFDQAIYRSERIISDCLRIGREGIQYKNALESSASVNGGATPNGPKMIRNPSRSKSPIKSSLKRTSSFTGSPQKSASTTPTAAGQNGIESNISMIANFQKASESNEIPLSNQTNKIINNLHATEVIYSSKQQQPASSPLIQLTSQQENNTNKTSPTTGNGSSYAVTDENKYIGSSANGIASRLTPNKPYSATEAPSTSAFSITSAYNTSVLSSQQSAQKTSSYLLRNQVSKENELSSTVPASNKTSAENSDYPSITLKKTESEIVDNSSSKEKNAQTNDQKRYSLQIAPAKPRQGILRYSDGSRYDGEILNNQRHGYGTLLSSDFQVIYQGDWQNDTYHGQGKFFNPMAENLFEEYDFNDFDIALSQYWESYEGEFYEGKLDGFGTLMLTNGEKLVGNFKKGRICGKGTFYCNKGPAITGNWEDNRLNEKY